MAEKADIYKGIQQIISVTGLEPGTQYYAMLVHNEDGEFICTDPVTPDSTGLAIFTFTFEQTNNIGTGSVTLQVFDCERNYMSAYVKNIGKIIETQLTDDTDVPSYQAEDV